MYSFYYFNAYYRRHFCSTKEEKTLSSTVPEEDFIMFIAHSHNNIYIMCMLFICMSICTVQQTRQSTELVPALAQHKYKNGI